PVDGPAPSDGPTADSENSNASNGVNSVKAPSKRIPKKYEDIVCDLNKKKEDASEEIGDQDEIRVTNDELGDNGGNGGNKCAIENGDEIWADCDANDGITCEDITEKGRIGEDKSYEAHEDAEIDVYNVSDSEPNKDPHVKNRNFPTMPTYASRASNNAELNRKLDFEPTLTEGGNEFVIFDEDLMCGVAVTLMRCLGKMDNEVFCFKFKHEEGMKFVLENSPWMKGISKLASSIGKPLVMDEMTANMCQYGKGRIGYARVLVEVDARKQFKEGIDVQYSDNNGSILRTKKIMIEYSWKPLMELLKIVKVRDDVNKEGFTDVRRKQYQQNNVYMKNQQANFGRRNNELIMKAGRKML
ncbi:hypothetical protein Tco_1382199, partial [Tanacetum coccineum]